jgi:hypothetical protein
MITASRHDRGGRTGRDDPSNILDQHETHGGQN